MGQEPLFDLVVIAGAALLAWRLRREHRASAATFLFLPAVMLAFLLARREPVVGAAGTLGAPAALAGVLAGLVVATRSFVRVEPTTGSIVVRATPISLLLWPGTLAIYMLGRRVALWLHAGGGDRAARRGVPSFRRRAGARRARLAVPRLSSRRCPGKAAATLTTRGDSGTAREAAPHSLPLAPSTNPCGAPPCLPAAMLARRRASGSRDLGRRDKHG